MAGTMFVSHKPFRKDGKVYAPGEPFKLSRGQYEAFKDIVSKYVEPQKGKE